MAELTHGMDLAQVRELGRFLQARAGDLDTLVATVDRKIRSTSWQGRDADHFRHEWWPRHRTRLSAMAEEVRGLGQSALGNADEQDRASGAGAGAGGGGGGGAVGGTSRTFGQKVFHLAEYTPGVGSIIEVGRLMGATGTAGGLVAYDLWYGVDSPDTDAAMRELNEQIEDTLFGMITDGVGSGWLAVDDVIYNRDDARKTAPSYWLQGVFYE